MLKMLTLIAMISQSAMASNLLCGTVSIDSFPVGNHQERKLYILENRPDVFIIEGFTSNFSEFMAREGECKCVSGEFLFKNRAFNMKNLNKVEDCPNVELPEFR